jgi:cytochrome c-type biogenesis protein CcmH
MTLDDAIARIEAQLKAKPDDLRGWSVIAPAYMQLGRFADAAAALRKVIELDGPTADRETDLGEALMMAKDGDASGEPLELFRSASNRDVKHVRSRYYLASEATRAGDFANAKAQWQALLKLSTGGESWVANAEAGLAAAEAGLGGDMPANADVASMVEGLSKRLMQSGGTIDEWTRLVRSRLVLGQTEAAQLAYDAARKAYPDAGDRAELDVLAADNGLVASN